MSPVSEMYHIAMLSHANDECTQHLGTSLLGVLVHHFSHFGLGKESAQMIVQIVSTVARLNGGEIREIWPASVAFHHRRSHRVHGRTLLIGGCMAAQICRRRSRQALFVLLTYDPNVLFAARGGGGGVL